MNTLIDLVANAAERYGERTALVTRAGLRDDRWSYQRLWRAVNSVATHLRESRGLNPGERVLFCAPNQPQLVASLLGAMLARVVPVPLDPFSTVEFTERVAHDTEAAAFVTGSPWALPGIVQIPLAELPYDAVAPPVRERPRAADLAELVYTSGTTGRPKGVMLTHGNIWVNALSADQIIPYRKPWRLLSLLPLSHMLEQTAGLFAQLHRGSTIVYGVPHGPAAIIKALRRYRVEAMVVVPAILVHMMRAMELEAHRRMGRLWKWQNQLAGYLPLTWRRGLWHALRGELGGALELCMCGGAYLSPEVARFWERLGILVVQGYGATECAPIIAGNTARSRVAGTVGRPVAGVRVRLSPEGEVQVQGANVTPGYWRNDEATNAAFTQDGWFRTGDLAEVDAAGNLNIKGRLKERVVLPSGLKVFLADLEEMLEAQPEIRACVVLDVARPSPGIGFTAVVIPDAADSGGMPARDRAESAVRAANNRLAPHQRISSVVLWDAADFPRTAIGKIKRAEVRAWFEQRPQGPTDPAAASAMAGGRAVQLAHVLSEVSGVGEQNITPQSNLNVDLALTSLSRVALALLLEERFGLVIDDGDLAQVETVAQLAVLLEQGGSQARIVEIPGWPRRGLARAARALLQLAVLFPMHRLLARPFVVQGKEKLDGLHLPALFIANHSSHMDTVSIIRALPPRVRRRLAVAAAADYFFRISMVGWATSLLLNTFPFSREGAVRASLDYCGELADAGWSVLVYPEGTRSTTGMLLPFKSGIALLASGLCVPVVPVAVLGGYYVLPKGRTLPRAGPVRVVFGAPMQLPPDIDCSLAVSKLHQAVADLMSEGAAASLKGAA